MTITISLFIQNHIFLSNMKHHQIFSQRFLIDFFANVRENEAFYKLSCLTMSISVRNKRYHKLIFFYNIFSEITHVHHYKTILPLRYKKSFRVSHARVLPQQTNNRNCSELNLDYYHHYLNMTIKTHYQVCVCVCL